MQKIKAVIKIEKKIIIYIVVFIVGIFLGSVGSGIIIWNYSTGQSNDLISKISQSNADLEKQLNASERDNTELKNTVGKLYESVKSSLDTISKLNGIFKDLSSGLIDLDGCNEEFRKLIESSGSKN